MWRRKASIDGPPEFDKGTNICEIYEWVECVLVHVAWMSTRTTVAGDISCHSFHAAQNHHHATHPQSGNTYQWCSPSSSLSSLSRNPSSSTVVGEQQRRATIGIFEMEDRELLEEQEQGKCLSSVEEDSALDEEDQHDFDVKYSDVSNGNTGTAKKVSGSSFEDVFGNTYSKNNHASTTLTNASIPSKAHLFHDKYTPFEERCNQLLLFKEEFGHCNVPRVYEGNPSLGRWCRSMRSAYSKLQKGTKVDAPNALFYKRYQQLVAFKKEFGHCNVPYKGYPSLGRWCRRIGAVYSTK